jgi:hypothetical protein
MSKQVLEDARAAFAAWREAPSGSYVERVLADGIVADIVPALIHAAERRPIPIGFDTGDNVELGSDTEIAPEPEYDDTDPDDEGDSK